LFSTRHYFGVYARSSLYIFSSLHSNIGVWITRKTVHPHPTSMAKKYPKVNLIVRFLFHVLDVIKLRYQNATQYTPGSIPHISIYRRLNERILTPTPYPSSFYMAGCNKIIKLSLDSFFTTILYDFSNIFYVQLFLFS
jgi:hypothetical protein